jgi:hypothetical protein
MVLQILAIHALGLFGPLGLQERSAEPVPRREGQELGLGIGEPVLRLDGFLEGGYGGARVACAQLDLAAQDAGEQSEQRLQWEVRLLRRFRFRSLVEAVGRPAPSDTRRAAALVRRKERRLSEIPDRWPSMQRSCERKALRQQAG